MAQQPKIQIGLDLETLKKQAERASKLISDIFKKATPGGTTAGGALTPKMAPVSMPVANDMRSGTKKKQGLLENLLFGDRGEQSAMRSIKSSLSQVSDTLGDVLGASKVGLSGIMAKVQGFGIVGGAALGAGGVAAAGLAGSVMYGRSQERNMFAMAPFMGRGAANRALGMGRRGLFDDEETVGYANSLARGGALGGLGAVLRGQRGLGLGSELSEVLTGQAQKGGRVTNRSATRELSLAVGTAVSTGLSRGRFGELLHGVAQMAGSRSLGIGQSNAGLYGALSRVGGTFRGAEGVAAVSGLERAYSNPATALGRSIALRTAGLGGGLGGDVFGAERRMELGFFGQGKNGARGTGAGGIDQMLGMYRQAFGFGEKQQVGQTMTGDAELRRGALIKEFSQNAGLSQTGAEAVINATEQGKGSDEIARLMKEGRPLQDRAYEAMINMGSFKTLEKAFQESFRELWGALGPLIIKLMHLVEQLLAYFTPKAVDAINNGISGAKILSSSEGRAQALSALPGAASEFVSQTAGAVGRRKALLDIASSGQGLGRLDTGSDLSPDEQQARDFMRKLQGIEKGAKGSKQLWGEAEAFSKLDNGQLQQIAAIVQASIKSHQTIVHVHNAPGLQATAHKIFRDGTGSSTALAAATAKGQ